MDQYEAFVKVSLKSRVGMTEDLIDAPLQFFLYEYANVYHTRLMSDLVPWRRTVVPATSCRQTTRRKLSLRHGQRLSWPLNPCAWPLMIANSVEGIATKAMTEQTQSRRSPNKHRDKFINHRSVRVGSS